MNADRPMGDETYKFLEQHYSDEYLEELKGVARFLAGDKAAQVDVSSLAVEALLKAARNHRQLRDPGKFRSWMKQILVNDVLARLQLAGHRRTQALEAGLLSQLPDPREAEEGPAGAEEKAQARSYLSRLLALLPEADREVICLCRLQGLPDAEAANLLGVSAPALRQRRSRALRRLKELARQHPES
jgi:RNA polymerase sigma-70 factor (ECF subfamily)